MIPPPSFHESQPARHPRAGPCICHLTLTKIGLFNQLSTETVYI
jgi:hypothetical protein